MDNNNLEEEQLVGQLEVLRLELKKRRWRLYILIVGVLGSLGVLGVCISTRTGYISPAEIYGVLPLILFLLPAMAMVVAGWKVGDAENLVRAKEHEILDIQESGR